MTSSDIENAKYSLSREPTERNRLISFMRKKVIITPVLQASITIFLPWVPEGFFVRSEAEIVSGEAAIEILARKKKPFGSPGARVRHSLKNA